MTLPSTDAGQLESPHLRVNAISGERTSPHPHIYSDRILRPGDQVYFDILHSYMGYRTCYYRTLAIGSASQSQIDAYKKCRELRWYPKTRQLAKRESSS